MSVEAHHHARFAFRFRAVDIFGGVNLEKQVAIGSINWFISNPRFRTRAFENSPKTTPYNSRRFNLPFDMSSMTRDSIRTN